MFEGAVPNYRGAGKIKTIDGNEEYPTLGAWEHSSILKKKYISQDVKVETIDNLVKQYFLNPGFIKVGVEGMGKCVLEGSKVVLETHRPVILSELYSSLLKVNGSSSKELINFIKTLDYNVMDAITPGISPEKRFY